MKHLVDSLFKTICLAFSGIVLILFLLTTIDTAAERDRRGKLAREVRELSDENERLRVTVQSRLGPEALERYAREELGMQPAGPDQILYVTLLD